MRNRLLLVKFILCVHFTAAVDPGETFDQPADDGTPVVMALECVHQP